MIARTEIDKCFSTALNGHGAFNFDNEERTELSPELARSALDFTIGVKKCYDDMGREARKTWRNAKKDAQCGFFSAPLKRADFMAGFFYRIHQKLEENPIRNDRDQVATESKKAEELFDRFKESNDVNETKLRMGNNMASRILGFDSAARVSLNRPCGNGMPSAGAIGKQGVLGLRT